jgi:DNA modification methylase
MKIENIETNKILPYINNPRKNLNADKVASSIKEFGFQQPIVVDKEMIIIVGHTRHQAAKLLGLKTVPVVIADLPPLKAKAYRIADNRLNEDSEWDMGLLNIEFTDLLDNNFEMENLGFDDKELERLIVGDEKGLTDDDDVPELPKEPNAKLGDIYQLGEHRLMCGDSVNIIDVEKLINNNVINCVYTDPPYGINIVKNNHVGGEKLAKVTDYKEIKNDDTIQTAIDSYNLCLTLQIPKMIFWGGNYYSNSLPNSSCWLIWDKNNTGNFADGEIAWTNFKTSVRIFKHTWNGMIRESEKKEKRVHPTQKPVALAEWCFKNYEIKKNVLDLFGGSGSTLIACEKLKIKCFVMELEPHYVDVIIKRWEDYTGKKAELING